jgi:hypothetical protein
VSPPNTTANEEEERASDNGAENAVNNTPAAMTMDDEEADHVVVNNTAARVANEEDLFNGGATTTMAGQSREDPAQPCFYIALSERAPAKVKVTTILTFRRLCSLNVLRFYMECASLLTIAPYLFEMQFGCSIQPNTKITTRYKTALGGDLIFKRFPFADESIFEVVDHFIETILSLVLIYLNKNMIYNLHYIYQI